VFWDGLREGCLSGVFTPRVPDRRSKILSAALNTVAGCPFFSLLFFGQAKKRRSPSGEKQY
jgi:hypothetical protein